jgi:hypothetical protein
MASVMEVGAGVAAHLGEPQRAARLVGAAEALRERAAIPPTAYDAALLVRLLAPARATAAPADWDAEVAAGRALTAEKGMDLLTGRGPAVGGAGQA